MIGMVNGPRVTRYELQLAPGIKVSRVSQLRDDLAYALATTEIRILAPIPGKQAVGVEVPNLSANLVTLGDIYAEPPAGSSPLTAWLGKDISGQGVACDLARMPHLLIAGTTGSGKSGCINAILCSILLRASPDQVRMILVDPKRVELNHYEAIPHLLTPVVTNMKNASLVLQNVVREMETRYETMGAAKARNLAELNTSRAALGRDTLPHILVVIDELADLMMVSPAEVEDAIIRLAQKSRAVGIHLVLATQSPRVDVITGMIKANVPSRIAFAVSSQTDSRVILDTGGAEALLGQGDMLYKPLGTSKLQRIQGAFISEGETQKIVEACRRQGEPTFEEELLELPADVEPESLDADEDPVLEDAIRLVAQHQTASVSLLQRRLRVGYTRAGRLIDMLERRGIVSGLRGLQGPQGADRRHRSASHPRRGRDAAARAGGRHHPLIPRTPGAVTICRGDRRLVFAPARDGPARRAGAVPAGARRRVPARDRARRGAGGDRVPGDRPARVRPRARGDLRRPRGVRALRGPARRGARRVRGVRARRAATRGLGAGRAPPPPPGGRHARDLASARGGRPGHAGAARGDGRRRHRLARGGHRPSSTSAARRSSRSRPRTRCSSPGSWACSRPGPKVREYTIALLVGIVADLLIVAAGAARGSQEYTGIMFLIEAGILGVVFGARLAVLASLTPLVAIGLLIGASVAIGSETCSPDCAQQAVDYLFVAVIVGSAAGVTGLLRDRYFPRAA